jgi:hypothetical protein
MGHSATCKTVNAEYSMFLYTECRYAEGHGALRKLLCVFLKKLLESRINTYLLPISFW